MTTDSRRTKGMVWLGILSIAVTGLVHVIDAPDAFGEAGYKGWAFYLNGLGSLLSGVGIYLSRRTWGWNLGCLVAGLSIILYVISRTIGLPHIPAEPDAWLEPLGVISLIAESVFIVVFVKTWARNRA